MTTILVPPGIGDVYWILTMLKSFREKNNLDSIHIYVYNPDPAFARSVDYITRHSFVDSAQYADPNLRIEATGKVRTAQFHGDIRAAITPNFMGFDYFISMQALFFRGELVGDVFPEYEIDWYPEMVPSKLEDDFKIMAQNNYGDYFLIHITSRGHYAHWLKYISRQKWYDLFLKIYETKGWRPVLTGKGWSVEDNDAMKALDSSDIFIDLTNQTNLTEFFGLIKGTKTFIGFQQGDLMMAALWGIPTFMIYHKESYFPGIPWEGQISSSFYKISLPPDTLDVTQFPIFVDEGFEENYIFDRIKDL